MTWRTVDGAFETHIAETTVSAFGDGDDLARGEHLEQNLTRFNVGDDGAHGHLERDVLTRRAKHVRAHAVLTAFGVMTARVAEVHQCVQVDVGHGKDMTAPATIATIRATELLVLFVPKRDAAITAVSSRQVDIGFVNEFHGNGFSRFINEKPRAKRRVSHGSNRQLTQR